MRYLDQIALTHLPLSSMIHPWKEHKERVKWCYEQAKLYIKDRCALQGHSFPIEEETGYRMACEWCGEEAP